MSLLSLSEFDKTLQIKNIAAKLIGIDEAGRGPLAGPVVAAACFIPPFLYNNETLAQINDSKKLTPKKRQKLYEELKNLPIIYGVGFASSQEIDKINILQATFLAMRRALAKFKGQNILALVDGNHKIPSLSCPQEAIIGGDAKSLSIAAASVIAKVSRDNFMQTLHQQYPLYGFSGHKGYGAKTHIDAIKEHGPCPQHRKSFEPIRSLYFSLFSQQTEAVK
ncbi:MAG: ribonuclease HII [Elusimicrobiota bacterium]|jgi:ribonuclease HII|nr:ribonuclease HII [Elusimicrobiota bacterium]